MATAPGTWSSYPWGATFGQTMTPMGKKISWTFGVHLQSFPKTDVSDGRMITCCQVDHAHLIDSVKNALSVCKTSNFDSRPGLWAGYNRIFGTWKSNVSYWGLSHFQDHFGGVQWYHIWGWISIERTSKLFSRVPVLIFCLTHYLVGGLEHEFYDFPFSWECHHPNWRTHIFQRGRYTPTSYKTIQLEEPPWANARDYHWSDILGLPQECKGDGLQQFERQSTYILLFLYMYTKHTHTYIHMYIYIYYIYISMYGHHWCSTQVRSITRSTAHGSVGAKSSECHASQRSTRNDARISSGHGHSWLGGWADTAGWWFQHVSTYNMGVSENSVPLNPMVNDHYPY